MIFFFLVLRNSEFTDIVATAVVTTHRNSKHEENFHFVVYISFSFFSNHFNHKVSHICNKNNRHEIYYTFSVFYSTMRIAFFLYSNKVEFEIANSHMFKAWTNILFLYTNEMFFIQSGNQYQNYSCWTILIIFCFQLMFSKTWLQHFWKLVFPANVARVTAPLTQIIHTVKNMRHTKCTVSFWFRSFNFNAIMIVYSPNMSNCLTTVCYSVAQWTSKAMLSLW